MIKVLELYSGTECISNAFRERGCEAFTIDWGEQFPSSMHCDIGKLEITDLPEEWRHPDVVWMAWDCTTYSLGAISKHRKKNPETGNLDPISDYARQCDETNQHTIELVKQLNPKVIWLENPRACLQNMIWMKPYDKYKHLITYCSYMQNEPYELRRMKPTNLWTNIPNPPLKKPCHNCNYDCHPPAPRGSNTYGTQAMKGHKERSTYPKELCEAIVDITLNYLKDNIR